jgi:hypothetical protein
VRGGCDERTAACVAIEYPFLLGAQPEVVIHAAEVQTPARPLDGHWHRADDRGDGPARRELAADSRGSRRVGL